MKTSIIILRAISLAIFITPCLGAQPSGTRTPADRAGSDIIKEHDVVAPTINVRAFGATGNGVTDDTAAMQAAHDTGNVVYYPAGTYKFKKITIAAGGIVGDGPGIIERMPGSTTLSSNSVDSDDAITFTGARSNIAAGAPIFHNFSIIAPEGAKPGGAAININPKVKSSHMSVNNVVIRYMPIGIKIDNADSYEITNSAFFFYSSIGVSVSNSPATDVGDSTITGCHFFNSNGGRYANLGTAIYQESGGGLRIVDNKINGGVNGYDLNVTGTTSITNFMANSVENVSGAALQFRNTANTASGPVIGYSNITITGNHFARNARDIYFQPIANFLNRSYWDNTAISGNVIFHENPAFPSIELNTARIFNIASNVITNFSQANQGIVISKTVSNGLIASNYIYGFAKPITNSGTAVTAAGNAP